MRAHAYLGLMIYGSWNRFDAKDELRLGPCTHRLILWLKPCRQPLNVTHKAPH